MNKKKHRFNAVFFCGAETVHFGIVRTNQIFCSPHPTPDGATFPAGKGKRKNHTARCDFLRLFGVTEKCLEVDFSIF
jgi:hypothetical protein